MNDSLGSPHIQPYLRVCDDTWLVPDLSWWCYWEGQSLLTRAPISTKYGPLKTHTSLISGWPGRYLFYHHPFYGRLALGNNVSIEVAVMMVARVLGQNPVRVPSFLTIVNPVNLRDL